MEQLYKSPKQLKFKQLGLLIFTMLVWLSPTKAQITLTSSTGSSTSASYTALKAAIDNINNGTHTGVISIKVHANTSEAAAINLLENGNVAGASYTAITINPADTATSVKVINATFSANTLLTLNGASNVVIDGRPLSTGTANLLSFNQTANVAGSHNVVFTNGASNNTIRYTTIFNGSIGSIVSHPVRFLTGSNANNVIINSVINGGNFGIEVAGTNGAANGLITIAKTLLINQKSAAIRLASGVGSMVIDSNDCTHSIATTLGGFQFLNITLIEPTATVTVTKNRVYNLNTSAANFLQGIIFSPAIASGTLNVTNNSISLGTATFPNTLSQIIRCFLFGGTAQATVVLEHNTFRIGGSQTTVNGNPTTCGILKTNSNTSTVFTSRNNISLNTRTGTTSQHVGAFYSTPTTGTNVIDYNTYSGGPNFLTAWIGTFHATIGTYKTAAAPLEQNSSFGLIDFNNTVEPSVNLNGPNTSGGKLAGTNVNVATDYYGSLRNANRPYRGAYEAMNPVDTFDLQTVILYTYGKIPIGTTDTVRVLVRNLGASPVVNEPIHLSSSLNGYLGSVNVSLPLGGEQIVSMIPYTPYTLGYDTLMAYPNADQKPNNDTSLWVRENTLNALSYSRPFLPQLGNVGTNPEGEIVAKFYTPFANFINQVNVNFTNAFFNGPFPFQVVIYEDSGANLGPKMNPLWESTVQNTVNGVFNLSIPSITVNGSFYIGVRQTSANNIGFAYQNENPIRNQTFYFRQGTGYITTAWNDFAVNPANQFRFMIEPRLTINDDLGVTDLFSPGSGCVNIGTQAVSFEVQNLGLLGQSFFNDTLSIYGKIIKPSGNTISFGPVYITNSSLGAGNTTNIMVIPAFNFDSAGAYTFTAWTKFGPDANAINDTLPPLVRIISAAQTAPVVQNFNAATFPTTFTTNRFAISTNNGTNNSNSIRVVINNTSPFAANAYVQTPRISGITTNSILRFDYRIINNLGGTAATLINTDSIKIMVSTDCGNTFTQVNLINGVNHIASANYASYSFALGAFIGTDVIVKIDYEWFGTTNDVVVDMDNIRIVDGQNDAGVVAVLAPCRSVILGSAAFSPSITVRNFGTSAQSNVPVVMAISGPASYNSSTTVSAIGIASSDIATFASTFNPTVAGAYTLKVWTALTTDGDPSNDTLIYTFNVTDVNLGNASVNAIQFNANTSLKVKNTPSFNATSGLTIEAWVNRNASAAYRTIIAKDSALGYLQYSMGINDNHFLDFFINTSSGLHQFTSPSIVPAGINHVAATFNGTNLYLYINGAVVFDTTLTASTIDTFNYDITIGNSGLGSTAFLSLIDELKIWNTSRTASQIRANMHTRLANASNANLMAYYRFDEGAGFTFTTDASGNCNTAEFSNIAPAWSAIQYPLGTPVVGTEGIFYDGTHPIGLTGLSMVYTGMLSGIDTVYAHKFAGAPIGISPITNPGGATTVHPAYWMLYRFGNGTSTSTNLEFAFASGNLNSGVNASDLKLFNRGLTETTGWTAANTTAASAVFSTQTVVFAQTQTIYNKQIMVGANNNPLPVTMLYLNAKANNLDAVVRWATGTEINCRGFALERSIDGKTFTEINFIKGAGNSKITQQYSYQDADIFTATKTAYYRLKQVDFDGSYTYSEVVVVKQEGVQNEQISVYPNPVMDKLTIEIETLKGGAADVIITDITGKTISSLPINVIKGFNKYELNNTTNLTNGVYMITIVQNGQKVYNSKFVKAN